VIEELLRHGPWEMGAVKTNSKEEGPGTVYREISQPGLRIGDDRVI